MPPPPEILPAGPITIAVAGDTLITRSVDVGDPALAAARDAVAGATLAIANLDMNLLEPRDMEAAERRVPPRWPFGSARQARALGELGVDVLSLANDHAADYGADGLLATRRVLDAEGLLHAGTGADLAEARAPRYVGKRVAIVAVAASSTPESRATWSRGDIRGRPGLNPLRYTADVTADPKTFQALKEGALALNGFHPEVGPSSRSGETVTVFGTPIRKGDTTRVVFVVDDRDRREILEQVTAARRAADVVIVSIHSHEPTNSSREPAEFLRDFARQAIDAGAGAVAVHGPHRVRGIEMYKGAAIFYSLGNFVYQTEDIEPGAAGMFDAGADLYAFALGSPGSYPGLTRVRPGSDPGSDPGGAGIVGVLTFDAGRLTAVRVHPVAGAKGRPMLREVEELSKPFGTAIVGDARAAAVQVDNR